MRIDKRILRNLLPGLIPLFVFVVADELWGNLVGLYVAVGTGILELAFSFFKSGKIEKFILLDLGLLILLGSVSVLLKDDIYFKLKPAFIEIIFAAILAFSLYSPKNIIFEMSLRYLDGVPVNPDAETQFNKSLKVIFFLTLVHIVLVFYSAWYMSRESWAFISGILFYVMIFAYFGGVIILKRFRKDKTETEEMLPVVDEAGNIIGKARRGDCHFDPREKILHPVVHLHVLNSAGEIFLQHRSMSKKVQPGKWDTAVGGHIAYGEDLETSLRREAEEEIGLTEFQPHLLQKYVWETDVERELVFSFVCELKGNLKLNPVEISEGRFWTKREIKENLGKGIFTANFEKEFMILSEGGKRKQ
jgi:isopentenyldiphosphate isomerase/intracellular septation protein A